MNLNSIKSSPLQLHEFQTSAQRCVFFIIVCMSKSNSVFLNFPVKMFFAIKARLKLTEDNNKLEICRRPGSLAWLYLGLSIIVFYGILNHLTENIFNTTICLLGIAMFELDKLGDWEEFILDKLKNRATFERYNWCEKLLCMKSKEGIENSRMISMKLSEICHVGVSLDLGLFLLLKNGKTTFLSTNNLNRNEIQSFRQEINRFINLSRIETLDKITNNSNYNLEDRLLIPSSDSDSDILIPESVK